MIKAVAACIKLTWSPTNRRWDWEVKTVDVCVSGHSSFRDQAKRRIEAVLSTLEVPA